MQIDPTYWIFPGEIPASICRAIVQEGNALREEVGVAGGKVDTEVRDSNISWLPAKSWAGGILWNYMSVANEQAWKFKIDGFQDLQFTRYKLNQHYDLHEDVFALEDGMRKLSVVIQLCDPSEYKGGEFVFSNGEEFSPEDFKKQGSVIVFPSMMLHGVRPVTEGTRYSLVGWATGPQLK